MPLSDYPWVSHRFGVVYDVLHLFVGPDGYRLSDRVWRAGVSTRNAIDELLDYHIRNGTAAVDIAKELEKFLKRERVGIRTKRPYGRWGSYDARRLARTEITAALGRGVIAAALANPFVHVIEWALSPNRTGEWDCNCEENATADEHGYGPGMWPVEMVPPYPDHPHCMCSLRPVTVAREEAIESIRGWLYGEEGAEDYGYLFDLTGLLPWLLSIWAG